MDLIKQTGEPIGTEPTRVFAPPMPVDKPVTTSIWNPPSTAAPTATFRPSYVPLFPEVDPIDDEDQDDDEPETRDPFSSTNKDDETAEDDPLEVPAMIHLLSLTSTTTRPEKDLDSKGNPLTILTEIAVEL